ncbi:chemotaxis protein CheW [Massilia sp. H-1]|nr:chemotaxis protein CheW [Massilia sp. H-1]
MTDVIILQLASCVVGMVVDGVTDVVGLYPEQISPIPGADGEGECDYLLGLGEAGGKRLILVDIDKLMSIRRERSEQRVA